MFPLLSGVTNRTYSYKGWRIQTAFIGGRAAMLSYSKANSQMIEDDELQVILKAESYGGEWKEKSQFSLNPAKNLQNIFSHPRLWTNSTGALAYFNNPQYLSLVIEAPIVDKFRKAKAESIEKRRKANIPDF